MSIEMIVALVAALSSPVFGFLGIVHKGRNERKAEERARAAEEKARENELTVAAFHEVLEEVKGLKRNSIAVSKERIKHLVRAHIKAGEVSIDERQDLIQLYESYRIVREAREGGLAKNKTIHDSLRKKKKKEQVQWKPIGNLPSMKT